MIAWALVGWLGCLCVLATDGQDALAARESRHNGIPQVPGVVPDNTEPAAVESATVVADSEPPATTNVIVTTVTASAPEPFTCYQCTDCSTKPELTTTPCAAGITMCYTLARELNNATQVLSRGCSAASDRCTTSVSEQLNAVAGVTCCSQPNCNQATRFLPAFVLSLGTLLTVSVSRLCM